jgi:hypothetical protein
MIWQAIRSKHAEAEDAARLRGLADADARKVAARAVRGDLRALMSELLTRAPVPAILDYLAVGSAWGEGGDRLIDQSDAVLQLVDAAYPQPTWTDLAPLEAKAADNDILWSTWIRSWADALRATGPAARAALEPATRPAAQAAPDKSSSLRRWAPWLVGAAAIVGATTLVATTSEE